MLLLKSTKIFCVFLRITRRNSKRTIYFVREQAIFYFCYTDNRIIRSLFDKNFFKTKIKTINITVRLYKQRINIYFRWQLTQIIIHINKE